MPLEVLLIIDSVKIYKSPSVLVLNQKLYIYLLDLLMKKQGMCLILMCFEDEWSLYATLYFLSH